MIATSAQTVRLLRALADDLENCPVSDVQARLTPVVELQSGPEAELSKTGLGHLQEVGAPRERVVGDTRQR